MPTLRMEAVWKWFRMENSTFVISEPFRSAIRLFISSRFMDICDEDKEWLEPAQDRVLWKVSNLRVLPLVSYLVTGKRGTRGSSVGIASL